MLYDAESNILNWEVSRGKIDHSIEIGNFIIHVSKTKKPILIEVLEASKFIGQFDKLKDIKKLPEIKSIPIN